MYFFDVRRNKLMRALAGDSNAQPSLSRVNVEVVEPPVSSGWMSSSGPRSKYEQYLVVQGRK